MRSPAATLSSILILLAIQGLPTRVSLRAGESRQRDPLPIAVEDASAPWSRPDGTGFANDIVAAAFAAAGVPIQQQVVPYARCRLLAMRGDVAACYSMARSPDLKGSIVFPSAPLFVCNAELVHNPAHPLPAARLRELPRRTSVGVVIGYEYPPEVEEARRHGAIVLKPLTSEEVLLRMVSAGRISAAIVNVNESKPLAWITARAGVSAGVARVGRIGALDCFLGFSVKHPRGLASMRQFESGMNTIHRNGTLARIERAWADSSRVTVARATATHGGGE